MADEPKAEDKNENQENVNGVGRPTLLTNELILKAREYLGTDKHNDGILTIEGLALELEVSRDTIYSWENGENKDGNQELLQEFSDIVTRVRLQQSEKLIQKGLNGTYNPVITKLLLAKHGYIDRSDVTSGDKPIPSAMVEFVGKDDSASNEENQG